MYMSVQLPEANTSSLQCKSRELSVVHQELEQKCQQCHMLTDDISWLQSQCDQYRTQADQYRTQTDQYRTEADQYRMEADQYKAESESRFEQLQQVDAELKMERKKTLELEKSLCTSEQLVTDLQAANAQLTTECEARLDAQKVEVEQLVCDECSRNESGIVDDIVKKHADEISRIRQEHGASLDEVKRGYEKLEEERRQLEEELETARKKMLTMDEEVNGVRSECESVKKKYHDEALTVAQHITDVYQQIVTQTDVTSDPTQLGESDAPLDWNVVQSRFTRLINHLQQLLADSEKGRHDVTESGEKEIGTLMDRHKTELDHIRTEHSEQLGATCRQHESELDHIRVEHSEQLEATRLSLIHI